VQGRGGNPELVGKAPEAARIALDQPFRNGGDVE
jgi:hypothetical protein